LACISGVGSLASNERMNSEALFASMSESQVLTSRMTLRGLTLTEGASRRVKLVAISNQHVTNERHCSVSPPSLQQPHLFPSHPHLKRIATLEPHARRWRERAQGRQASFSAPRCRAQKVEKLGGTNRTQLTPRIPHLSAHILLEANTPFLLAPSTRSHPSM